MMRIEGLRACHAAAVSALIRRNLIDINSRDYPAGFIAYLVDYYSPEWLIANAEAQHLLVALDRDRVVGTGGLADFGEPGSPRYYGVMFFVAPERQGQGIGTALVRAVEAKARELGAEHITVRAAIGARGFYERLGYRFPDDREMRDEHGDYILEKAL